MSGFLQLDAEIEVTVDDPGGEHHKTVYAHFGVAIYLSQVLEHGLTNALLILDLVPRAQKVATQATWPERVDSFYESQFKRTLGSLIRRLHELVPVRPELEALLTKALDKRNWLSHHYFRERAAEFFTSAGRDKMIEELEEAQALFSAADRTLEEVIKPIRQRYGYSDELLEATEVEVLKKARGEL